MMMDISFLMLVFLPLIPGGKFLHREKRYVIFPRGGSYKMVIGIGTPLKLGSKQSMSIGWNFQMQYAVPTNLTQIQTYPPNYTGRRKRGLLESDRSMIYRGFEDVLNGAGIDGKACILRSICENAMDSMNHEANGLFGLLFHIAFTPSYGDGQIDPDLDPEYLDAQKAGEYGVDCSTLYANCSWGDGILGLFTILDHEYG
ncbi:uncharacterized protein [Leptinotarsa decemlineata]|uniref:uncharacterized protein n=1 Tax=Leptinotarsa decemlineata TaxID=7539 RepID=UPI000C2546FD|nr:uncharacterized protein LOC111502710 [Leptinotarsa decemlineata]